MRRLAAIAVIAVMAVRRDARAERLVLPDVEAPAELADEAGAITLLVRSSLAKLTLVAPARGIASEDVAKQHADHAAIAVLARAGTGLELAISTIGADGKRETATVRAADGDVVALAGGMVDRIGAATQTTPQPVKPFALGELQPYAEALRLAPTDPAAAIAWLADAKPAIALGLPAIGPVFGDLVGLAPTSASRLIVARAIGAADVVATIGAGKDSVGLAGRAFAAIDRGDLATAETALLNASGGLAALARATIAAQHDDVRLAERIVAALDSDQHRAALALASTLQLAHVPPSLHRVLVAAAEKASSGVASRIGFAAAKAGVDPARALALVTVRELDQYAIDALEPILDAHRDIAKPTLLRLRAELAMRTGQAIQVAIDAYLAAAPTEPRALQYKAWSKLASGKGAAATDRAGSAEDDAFVTSVNEPKPSSPLDLVLPIVAGAGVLALVAILVVHRRRRNAPVKPEPMIRRAVPEPRPTNKLRIDMTTANAPPPIAELPEQPVLPPPSPARELPRVKPRTLPPPIELGSGERSPLDVDRKTPIPERMSTGARKHALEVDSPFATFASADPLGGDADELAPPPEPARAKRPSAIGSGPEIALGSTPQLAIDLVHTNLVGAGDTDGRPLAAILKERRRIPWLEAVGIIDQVCAGLAYAHANQRVHGGIEPSAIIVSGRTAKLGGFGSQTRAPYLAPDRGKAPRASDDLYAIGAILCEMLAGYGPTAMKTPDLGDAPPKLQTLVMSLLAKSAADRPVSVAQVRTAFKSLFDF